MEKIPMITICVRLNGCGYEAKYPFTPLKDSQEFKMNQYQPCNGSNSSIMIHRESTWGQKNSELMINCAQQDPHKGGRAWEFSFTGQVHPNS